MTGPGHNGGPSMEPGASWRRHCWQAARSALFPTLPVEVVRLRVRRAAELGLDYRTYAGVRASTGHDLVAFLFSTNALGLLREKDSLGPLQSAKLAAIRGADRLLAVQPPLDPRPLIDRLACQAVPILAATRAPGVLQSWGQTRRALRGFLASAGLAADGVLVIGDTGIERGWAEAAQMAGYLAADRFFAPVPT